MGIALLLLVIATSAAAVVAYGNEPLWGQWHAGLHFILLSRRLEWPLIALAILCCIALAGLIVAGKRRAWWLIGFCPILALFVHRFLLNREPFVVNRDPQFVSADKAGFLSPSDWVVGLIDDGDAVAYPYFSLYRAPLVVQSNQQAPLLLMWSAFANRALAERVDRTIRPSEMEVVSMPDNTLLVYNARIGQFINGVTGLTFKGQTPGGFERPIATEKMPWPRWRSLHPMTRVLVPIDATDTAPHGPISPWYPMPKTAGTNSFVAVICTTRPSAVDPSQIGKDPVNYTSSDAPLLLARDPATGLLRCFDRTVQGDLEPTFTAKSFRKFPEATMADSVSDSAWTADGRAISGPLKGESLRPLEVDDQVSLSVLRVWYPSLSLLDPIPARPPVDVQAAPAPHSVHHARHRRSRPVAPQD